MDRQPKQTLKGSKPVSGKTLGNSKAMTLEEVRIRAHCSRRSLSSKRRRIRLKEKSLQERNPPVLKREFRETRALFYSEKADRDGNGVAFRLSDEWRLVLPAGTVELGSA